MRNKYRLFKPTTGIYFIQDNATGKQESLRTRNKQEAQCLLNARNEAYSRSKFVIRSHATRTSTNPENDSTRHENVSPQRGTTELEV
jgi:hypothetical protein